MSESEWRLELNEHRERMLRAITGDEEAEPEFADPQRASLGEGGYMFTPTGLVRLAHCDICSDDYIDRESLDAHIAKEHKARRPEARRPEVTTDRQIAEVGTGEKGSRARTREGHRRNPRRSR
jgi:hypothetical protein